jgi:hypothetical protein
MENSMLLSLPTELLEHIIFKKCSFATTTALLATSVRANVILKRMGKLKSIPKKDIYLDIFKMGSTDLWQWFQRRLQYPSLPPLSLRMRCLEEAAKGNLNLSIGKEKAKDIKGK